MSLQSIPFRNFRIFGWALLGAIIIVGCKYLLHHYDLEPIVESSLHNGAISSVIFVLGFLLSTTIADYKESERIPADFSSTLETMYNDGRSIHRMYPVFDLQAYRVQLHKIAIGFSKSDETARRPASEDIRSLFEFFEDMHKGNVPPPIIVNLRQQQARLLASSRRVKYIQRIKFIPSASILAYSLVIMLIGLLLLTNIDPFYGGLVISGIVTFALIYILLLIDIISIPFHAAGKTQDDVSLFLISDVASYLAKPLKISK